VARTGGFSLHAGIAAKAHQREKLERLCRYIARPAVVTERLSLTRQGDIRVALKTPYRDGTTHVVFQPLDFIARLAALVPPPRVNLTRFHGLFAPNSHFRAQITPAGRGRRGIAQEPCNLVSDAGSSSVAAKIVAAAKARIWNRSSNPQLPCTQPISGTAEAITEKVTT